MADSYGPWRLELFMERFQSWRQCEKPPDEVAAIVAEWVPTRADNPRGNTRRLRDEGEFLQAFIPGAFMKGVFHDDQQVVCSYWVVEAEHKLLCDGFGTLGCP